MKNIIFSSQILVFLFFFHSSYSTQNFFEQNIKKSFNYVTENKCAALFGVCAVSLFIYNIKLNSRIKKLTESNNVYERVTVENKKHIEGYERKVKELNNKIQVLQQKTFFEKLTSKVIDNALYTKIQNLAKDKADLTQKNNILKEETIKLTNLVSEERGAKEQLSQQIEKLKQEQQTFTDQIDKLKETVDKLTQEKNLLNQNTQDREQKYQELLKEKNELEEKVDNQIFAGLKELTVNKDKDKEYRQLFYFLDKEGLLEKFKQFQENIANE